ncbi:MAG: ATP-binding protein, partial [Candidatus Electrothrix sp. AUS4]|nr:ATP-binding protein [Candidatus Electrothrix sp. AUS4]
CLVFCGAENNEEQIDQKRYWPDFEKNNYSLIILRMARDLCKGELWQNLIAKPECSNKLIAVFTATDLRHAEVRVSRELSWEQTISDVMKALTSKELESTRNCKYVLVSFDAAGVLIWCPKESTLNIIYTPNLMEGEAQSATEGSINGHTYCLISALTYCIAEEENPDYENLITTLNDSAFIGIHTMNELYLKGFFVKEEKDNNDNPLYLSISSPVDVVKNAVIAGFKALKASSAADKDSKDEALKAWEKSYSAIAKIDKIPVDEILSEKFSILNHLSIKWNVKDILEKGIDEAMKGVPVCKLNNLIVIDREEIESLHSIRNIVIEYDQKRKSNFSIQPLSLAVFGPPGSGKSFAVKQLAEYLAQSHILQTKHQTLEFNLSQFSDPKELIEAFHQIRDAVLSGKLPFVFWDEFDSEFDGKKLGWLKYFLAPMQDGTFQDGQITHPIGSCIFVFAGGTYHTFSEFEKTSEKEGTNNSEKNSKKLSGTDDNDDDKSSKKPDFMSRLKGHLTIKGINEDNGGNHYKIRRAILLRGLLKKYAESIWTKNSKKPNIHNSVINAFMDIDKYKNGVRSMEAIIVMSRLSGEMEFTASALPPSSQLNIHVEGEKFIKIAYGHVSK